MNKDTLLLTLLCIFSCSPVHADQILLTNGDRLTGTILETGDEFVTFESELLGLLYPPLASIEEVVRGGGEAPLRTPRLRPNPALVQSNAFGEGPGSRSGRLWRAALDAGLSLTDGNSDTRTINVGLQAERTTEGDRTSLYLTSLFASNSTSGESLTTANAIRGGGRYEIDLNQRLFTFGFSDLEFDRFQDLDLRVVLGGGLGLNILDRPSTMLQIFAGGSSNQEYFGSGLRRKSGESVVGEEWTYRITDTTSLTERLAVYANLSNVGEYRMTFDSTATTRLNDWLSWQVTLSDRYLSNPRSGKRPNDLLFTTGIRITVGEGNVQNIGPSVIAVR